jgi:hypothetical protein
VYQGHFALVSVVGLPRTFVTFLQLLLWPPEALHQGSERQHQNGLSRRIKLNAHGALLQSIRTDANGLLSMQFMMPMIDQRHRGGQESGFVEFLASRYQHACPSSIVMTAAAEGQRLRIGFSNGLQRLLRVPHFGLFTKQPLNEDSVKFFKGRQAGGTH